jgi:serine/threonine protein phosphatase PrpC
MGTASSRRIYLRSTVPGKETFSIHFKIGKETLLEDLMDEVHEVLKLNQLPLSQGESIVAIHAKAQEGSEFPYVVDQFYPIDGSVPAIIKGNSFQEPLYFQERDPEEIFLTKVPVSPLLSSSFEGASEKNLIFASCETPGPYRKMEDRFDICCAVPSFPSWHYFGVFDGHGGKFPAEFLSVNLSQCIDETTKEMIGNASSEENGIEQDGENVDSELLKEILIKSCLKMDKQLQNHPKMQIIREPGGNLSYSSGGSTAIIALITPKYVAIANVGDSRAVLGRRKSRRTIQSMDSVADSGKNERKEGKASEGKRNKNEQATYISPYAKKWGTVIPESGLEAVPLSCDHKFSIPEETERAVKAGAT